VLGRLGSQLCERNRHLGFVSRQGTSVLCQHWSDCRELAPIRVVLTFVLVPAINPARNTFCHRHRNFLKDTLRPRSRAPCLMADATMHHSAG
jgi:hypothetical protein